MCTKYVITPPLAYLTRQPPLVHPTRPPSLVHMDSRFTLLQEHSDGNILLVLLTSSNPSSTLIDVFFFINSDQYNDRSRASLTFLPSSHLAPIERTLLESVIEFRNVNELDTWLPSESIEKLSLSDLAKSVAPQRNSTELAPPPSQKRKQRFSPAEEDPPLFRKMRSYLNKLPPFSSVFNSNPPPPPLSSHPTTSPSSKLHLLFPAPLPSIHMNDLINRLPYEILVHIYKFLSVDDVLPCAQVCHRAWQVANLDIVWRDLMAVYTERKEQRETREQWDKYTPPTYPRADSPCSSIGRPSDTLFDVQIPTLSSSSDVSTDCSSRNSSFGVISMDDGVYTQAELDATAEQRMEALKISLDTIQGYARYVLSPSLSPLYIAFSLLIYILAPSNSSICMA